MLKQKAVKMTIKKLKQFQMCKIIQFDIKKK